MQKSSFIATSTTVAILMCPFATSIALASTTKDPVTTWMTSYAPTQRASSLPTTKPLIATDKKLQDWIKFSLLASEWKKQRGTMSSVNDMVALPAYQSIIAMGEPAVPLLIAQLKSEGDDPDLWFWALALITNENPIEHKDQGNFSKMAKSWINWAIEEGHAV